MPHNDHAAMAGQYPAAFVPTPAFLRRLDQAASESIDGDNGGAWAPSSPVIIGGAGASLTANGSLSGVRTGKRAANGGGIILTTAYVTISPARARTTAVALRDFLLRHDDETESAAGVPARPYSESGPSIVGVSATFTGFACRIPSFRIHNGYAPTRVTLRMRVGTRPAVVPTSMPGFVVTRTAQTGVWNLGQNEYYAIPTRANLTAYNVGDLVIPSAQNGRQFRCTIAGTSGASQPALFGSAVATNPPTTFADGSVTWAAETGPAFGAPHMVTLPRPSTVDAYFNQGNFQDISFVPNLNGVWDSKTYGHNITVTDASGTNNAFPSLRMDWLVTTLEPML
jgi:hypothetical protein